MAALVWIAFLTGCYHGKSNKSPETQTVRFTRHGQKAVFLAGQFNDWSTKATPMRRDGGDRWVVDVPLSAGKYEYKFVVDGQWEQDISNPDKAPDGFDGFNSVISVPSADRPSKSNGEQSKEIAPPPSIRPEARWSSIQYPDIDIPGAPGRTITGRLSPGKDGDGRPDELLFRLIFYQPADKEIPQVLVHPETFVVRLHRGDGSVVEGKSVFGEDWTGFGNQNGLTRGRIYTFPWGRNAFDEAWIEWRLPNQTFWFEVPYGFSRDPAQPWPSPDPARSEPHLASAMNNLGARDLLIPWRLVEYELGEIQNHWRLTANMANSFQPAVETVLYHAPDEWRQWQPEEPRVSVQMKGHGESFRLAFRRQGMLDRVDTFRTGVGAERGRDTGVEIIHVDDRSYEFTIPSSLSKYDHGRADRDNAHRFRDANNLFEQLIRAAD